RNGGGDGGPRRPAFPAVVGCCPDDLLCAADVAVGQDVQAAAVAGRDESRAAAVAARRADVPPCFPRDAAIGRAGELDLRRAVVIGIHALPDDVDVAGALRVHGGVLLPQTLPGVARHLRDIDPTRPI